MNYSCFSRILRKDRLSLQAKIIMMEDKKILNSINDYLRIIERTRLLCNSSEELGKLVGFSISSGNGLVRMGGKSPFLKDAIFRELAHLVEEDYDLDLQQVLDAYIEADQLIDKYGVILKKKSVPYSLIKCFYGDEDISDDISPIAGKLAGRHIPLLILMLIGGLPRISSKGGDVKAIAECYKKLFKLLRETVCTNTPIKILPALIQMEDLQWRDPSIMNRIHLIYTINFVLNAYGSMSTRMRLVQSNREFEETLVTPDIEGIWTEDNVTTIFWRFEELSNGFKLRRYLLNEERKELKFTEFFMRFFCSTDSSWAAILHPKSTEYTLEEKPIPNQYLSCVLFDLTDNQLTFEPILDEGRWFNVRRLGRSKYADYLEKLLTDDSYTKINDYHEYDYEFTILLSAITKYHIYIDTPDGRYYKIPKSLNECLDGIGMNDVAGIIKYRDKTYLAFETCNLYYDISTPHNLADLGVEIVDTVTTEED